MNFASPFSYVETNEEEEAGVEVLDDSDLEEGVMGEVRCALCIDAVFSSPGRDLGFAPASHPSPVVTCRTWKL